MLGRGATTRLQQLGPERVVEGIGLNPEHEALVDPGPVGLVCKAHPTLQTNSPPPGQNFPNFA